MKIMGNTAEKPTRIKRLIKFARKLKKMLRSHSKRCDQASSVSPARPVSCEELFFPPQGKKVRHKNDYNYNVDPFLVAHIAAQNHFNLRPNIHL